MPSTCKQCGSTDLARRGKWFRNLCKTCYNSYQREKYHANQNSIQVRRNLYQKHAVKRRAEAAAAKNENRDRYTLLEWFRRQGVRASELPEGFEDLVVMKQALRQSKEAAKPITQP